MKSFTITKNRIRDPAININNDIKKSASMLKKVIIWLVKTIFSAFVEEIHNRRKEEEDEATTTPEKGK